MSEPTPLAEIDSVERLKAIAYDLISQIEVNQQALEQVNARIKSLVADSESDDV